MLAVCYHFPCPTPMFLTTPEYILKPSSSASLPIRFIPPFSVFLLPIYRQRRNLTQSDSHFILNSFLLNVDKLALCMSMTSAPLSPALPLFLHVAASRTRACWIRLAPTHQLSTLPCPLELHPPFSGTTRSLDTPAVGSPMMCCLPYAHKLGCLRLGRSRQKISTPLTQLSLLPPHPISVCLFVSCFLFLT